MPVHPLTAKFQDRHFYDDHPELIGNHLGRFFKEGQTTVFHEMLSLDFHLDVYFINDPEREYNILLTSGMSLLEMTVPDAVEDKAAHRFAELMMIVPKSIEFGSTITGEGGNDWIINLLKETARFPHHYDTWLSTGHTLQATEDMEPYDESTEYTGVVILPSVTFEEDFTTIASEHGPIHIYSVFPLYRDELEYKIANGYNALLDRLIEKDAREIFDYKRASLLERRIAIQKSAGIFITGRLS